MDMVQYVNRKKCRSDTAANYMRFCKDKGCFIISQ
jgi:hypothetical protein